MKLRDIVLIESASELEKKLQNEISVFNKIDHPSSDERTEHNKKVLKIKAQISKEKGPQVDTSKEATDTRDNEAKTNRLTRAKDKLAHAESKLAAAKTDKERNEWKGLVAVAKIGVEKANK